MCMVVVDARGHSIAIELYLVQPLSPRRRLLNRLGKLRRDELRKGSASTRRTGIDGLRGRALDDTGHVLGLNTEDALLWPLNALIAR